MRIAVLGETFPGERRVALTPANVPALLKAGAEVWVESQAGASAGFPDSAYTDKGARILSVRDELFAADILLQVRAPGANPTAGQSDLPRYRAGQVVVGAADPLGNPAGLLEFAATGATLFALELIPRITRAQSMDILSSQATIAGYRAVLLAALELPKMFPMMMTAAGTLSAARVLIVGVGVAGLQAIASARKLGGIVSAYDVRPACREQVESLGAKFVELPLEASASEDKGGYAKAMDEAFYQRQRELLGDVVAQSDVVITTAAIPGKKSPLLVTANAVTRMQPGSVVVDLAAERGGNCELTRADQRTVAHGVTLLGPTNLPAEVPYHASQMFSNNVAKFLGNLFLKGGWVVNEADEIVRETMATQGGEVVLPRLRDLLQLPPRS
ncbi:MAG: NAD(P) transhydrogenase subunit alpha [Pirellulales bacterium]